MNEDQENRLVVAFERLADALVGIHDVSQRAFDKQFPEIHGPKEAILTRVLSDEDKILESQGATDKRSIGQWLGIPDDEAEYIGTREKQFLEEQAKNRDSSAEAGKNERQSGGSTEASGSQAGTVSIDPAPQHDDQRGRKRTRRAKSSS